MSMGMGRSWGTDLITVGGLTGMALSDRAGHKLGVIKEIYVDLITGQIEFVLGATGGFLGVGEKFHPIPWSTLAYRADPQGYVAGFDKAQLAGGPAYDRDQLASAHYGWAEQVTLYFQSLGLAVRNL